MKNNRSVLFVLTLIFTIHPAILFPMEEKKKPENKKQSCIEQTYRQYKFRKKIAEANENDNCSCLLFTVPIFVVSYVIKSMLQNEKSDNSQ